MRLPSVRLLLGLLTVLLLAVSAVRTPRAQASKGLDELLDLYVRDGEVYYRALKAERRRLDGYLSQAASTSLDKMARDELLDFYVREGEVYYRALKAERRRLDGYLSQAASTSLDKMARDEQLAFWLNAYNALVLQTVVDHYPIQGSSREYPARSIRQIPGAFERVPHRVAGRALTLDQIEQAVLPEFNDPRVYLALGRASEGGGRLRSEAYAASRLEAQLSEVAAECVSRVQCIQIDPSANRVSVSSIFSWREKEFSAAFADRAPAVFAARSPIERAVLAFAEPRLLTTEKEFLDKNTFQVVYHPFDWRLNDLTGRGGR